MVALQKVVDSMRKLDHWNLDSHLGSGGGGVVVEATNRETGGKVALKMVAIKNEGQCGLAEGGSLCQERIWKS